MRSTSAAFKASSLELWVLGGRARAGVSEAHAVVYQIPSAAWGRHDRSGHDFWNGSGPVCRARGP